LRFLRDYSLFSIVFRQDNLKVGRKFTGGFFKFKNEGEAGDDSNRLRQFRKLGSEALNSYYN
jgi:hypothetical protein